LSASPSTPTPPYAGPRDAQTDTILEAINDLLRAKSDKAKDALNNNEVSAPSHDADARICPTCGHQPGVAQGGVDAVEELRLLKDQVRVMFRVFVYV
jgi:hypothetical protein